MTKKTVAIIGAGKVGSVLAKALHQQGYTLVGIASNTLASARCLARELNTVATVRASEITLKADLVLLTTPDRYIGPVAAQISQEGGFYKGQTVLHTSGSTAVEVLSTARTLGTFIGSIHPLQSFANRSTSPESLRDIYFALGGDKEAVVLGEELVQCFGGKSFTISDQDRALYHGAACIASNYFVALMHWATNIYTQFGLSPTEAVTALMPLVEGTLQNIKGLGPTQALTGPISRGDIATIEAHLQGLKNQNEQALYAALGRYTAGVALEKGTIQSKQAKQIETVLHGEREKIK